MDDLVVQLPAGGLADSLITAARRVPGVLVESLRPYHGGGDLHRDLELVDALAADPSAGRELLVRAAPGVFRAGWALLLEAGPSVLAASPGSPGVAGLAVPWLPLPSARRMDLSEGWVPERWVALGTELAVAPFGSPARAVLVGRPGGPRFRASEVLRLRHLAGIAATVALEAPP